MAEQECSKCKEMRSTKDFQQYTIQTSGKISVRKTCRFCRNSTNMARLHRSGYAEKRRLAKRALKEELVEYMGGECQRCSGVFPAVCYDFHHIHPEDKLYTISDLMAFSVGKVIQEKLYEELAKCKMVCSNCHRLEHFGED